MNYIDCDTKGQAIVYLQNVDVKTNIPSVLRDYKYCIHCGIDTRTHPIINSKKDVNYCTTLGEGLRNKKIALSFGKKEKSLKNDETYSNYQDHYVFNLTSLNELNKIQEGNADYPIRTSLDYCPYCGYGYSINSEIQNTNFLIRMNYLV
ncbi:MAG TPA: hypothetical protein VE619_08995 [Nitrososphaeraceae archaeon]|nr:hypothetical protein [Nitrososphaeraceae archaeon]